MRQPCLHYYIPAPTWYSFGGPGNGVLQHRNYIIMWCHKLHWDELNIISPSSCKKHHENLRKYHSVDYCGKTCIMSFLMNDWQKNDKPLAFIILILACDYSGIRYRFLPRFTLSNKTCTWLNIDRDVKERNHNNFWPMFRDFSYTHSD